MTTTQKTKASSDHVEYVVALNTIIAVMSELKKVIDEENSFLSQGYPASLLSTTEKKTVLAKRYINLGNYLAEKQKLLGKDIIDARLHALLVDAGEMLCSLDAQNSTLLMEALNSTQRRIDKVMSAILTTDYNLS